MGQLFYLFIINTLQHIKISQRQINVFYDNKLTLDLHEQSSSPPRRAELDSGPHRPWFIPKDPDFHQDNYGSWGTPTLSSNFSFPQKNAPKKGL